MDAFSIVMPETTLSDLERKTASEGGASLPMDEETFRAFYDRTARQVWAYLAKITGDAQLADDLLQEAYYRFYRARTVYEDESHRRNSLYRIATNLARDSGRRRRRGRDVALPDDSQTASFTATLFGPPELSHATRILNQGSLFGATK